MFCPKCGSERFSDAVRFCSRCGFPLDEVARLVANDGRAMVPGSEGSARLRLFRRIAKRPGAKLVFLSIVLIPFMLLCSFAADSPIPLVIDLGIYFIGMVQILYHHLFRADQTAGEFPARIGTPTEPRILPPASVEANVWPWAKGTAEMVAPPSVTEPTTRLLDRE